MLLGKDLARRSKKPQRKNKSFDQTIVANVPEWRYAANDSAETAELNHTLSTLTRREQEIVELIRRGCSNKEIARELGIAVTTVKWNMTNILGKFGVETSKQLIVRLATIDKEKKRFWLVR